MTAAEPTTMGKDKKKRVKHPRTPMPRQKPEERVRNFSEVALGYTEEQAAMEAELAGQTIAGMLDEVEHAQRRRRRA